MELSKTLAMTAADLLRHVPVLLQSSDFIVNGNAICFEADQRMVRITYQEQAPVRMGAMALPRLELQFIFTDYSPEQAACFMRRFDRIYQKGGG